VKTKPIAEKRKIVVITESRAKSKKLQELTTEVSKHNWKFFEVTKEMFSLPKTGAWIDEFLDPVWNVDKSIHNIKTSLLAADDAYICTDIDAEGEALAYKLQDIILKHSEARSRRIVIDEITQTNLTIALGAASVVDEALAKSHSARLVITKLLIEPLKVYIKRAGKLVDTKGHSLEYSLTIFPLLAEIVRNERARRTFIPQKLYYVDCEICKGKAKATSLAYTTKESAFQLIDRIRNLEQGELLEIDYSEKSEEIKASSPATTSILFRDMILRGWKPAEVIQAARILYDNGFITYFKTNRKSLNRRFAEKLWAYARAQKFQVRESPKNYLEPGYGEVIRPTSFLAPEELLYEDKIIKDLYEIVWFRTLNTQLLPSRIKKQAVDYITEDGYTTLLQAEGTVVEFLGTNPPEAIQQLDTKTLHRLGDMTIREEMSKPPARYTIAGLIKWLDEKAIGRAENYEEVLEQLIDNRFAQEDEKGEMVLTDRGELIHSTIANLSDDISDPSFCAQFEEDLEAIASRKAEYADIVIEYSNWIKSLRMTVSKYEAPYPESCPQCLAPLRGMMDIKRINPYVKCKACSWWNFITFDAEGNIILSPNFQKSKE
jgi:DNA topoisomerase-1